MTRKKKNAGKPASLRIEGEMTIYRAHELRDMLLDKVSQSSKLEIDLSGVTELDTCGLQLLLMTKKVSLSNEGEMSLVASSKVVTDVFDLLNLAPFFDSQSAE